ncbi:MAG: hypothetical protein KAH21_12810, partial [Spirochaetaceae bacterium]|nr:hypothetical protein [Spirochaetaceae bacterium]
MTKGTKSFLNFLFFISAAAGSASIVYAHLIIYEYALLIPTGVVLIFAFAVTIAQKAGSDGEAAEHYADSIYFLGFLFTLVSLAALFYKLGSGGLGSSLPASQLMALSTKTIEETFAYIGIAVTTSVAGVLLRNIVRSKYLKNNPGGQDDIGSAVVQLKQIAEGMNGGFSDTMSAIGSYFEQRKDLAGQMKKKEKAYVDGLEKFTDTIDRFSKRLDEVEKGLLDSAESLGNNLKKQADGISSADQSLRGLTDRLHSLKNDTNSIDLKSTANEVAAFGRETGEL